MKRKENLFQPPEYPAEMFSEYFESAKARALRVIEIEAILGDDYDLDRLRELVEADRDGRCVVLLCKIDDEVYVNIMGKTLPSTVVSVSWITETPTFKAMHGVQLCFIFKSEDVGKTVFLTREAADAALTEQEGGQRGN